ncbi:hypothetical protein [Bacillus sp. KH172YL63]|uniref:hypothetical protein n=1 Tax=Bacillus sp. KH172YL63 TaxID=2709784 RepID=UPI0013E4986E|nr:hypothetical protein [Bacillus sp. KH172YL63]BCB04063.1 hypothetical protein KH172YL63_21960 [Bacillus sp. KH172YL63]
MRDCGSVLLDMTVWMLLDVLVGLVNGMGGVQLIHGTFVEVGVYVKKMGAIVVGNHGSTGVLRDGVKLRRRFANLGHEVQRLMNTVVTIPGSSAFSHGDGDVNRV